MSDHHGNTPAAWTAVVVALIGFTAAGIALDGGQLAAVLGRRRARPRGARHRRDHGQDGYGAGD